MRAILEVLILGVSVDGGHETLDNAEFLIEDLGNRSQAVGGAGSVGDNVLGTIVYFVVNAHNDGGIFVLGRSGNDDLLGASFNVATSLVGIGKDTGGFNNNVYAKLTPRKSSWAFLDGESTNLRIADVEVLVVVGNFLVKATQNGVVLE